MNWKVFGVVVIAAALLRVVVNGAAGSCSTAWIDTSRVAEAVKRRVYGWLTSSGMSFWPIIESQTLTVPAGTSAHRRPEVTVDGVLPLLHHEVLPLSNVPLRTRS